MYVFYIYVLTVQRPRLAAKSSMLGRGEGRLQELQLSLQQRPALQGALHAARRSVLIFNTGGVARGVAFNGLSQLLLWGRVGVRGGSGGGGRDG